MAKSSSSNDEKEATISTQIQLLTTKQLPAITGFSTSYFEKGRNYGYGPRFIRSKTGGRSGKILYRRVDIENWLSGMMHDPEGDEDV